MLSLKLIMRAEMYRLILTSHCVSWLGRVGD